MLMIAENEVNDSLQDIKRSDIPIMITKAIVPSTRGSNAERLARKVGSNHH
jgi:hypothetical protein